MADYAVRTSVLIHARFTGQRSPRIHWPHVDVLHTGSPRARDTSRRSV